MKTIKHSTKPKKLTKALIRKEMDQELCTSLNQKRFWPISEERVMALVKDLKLMFLENHKMITLVPWRLKHDIGYEDIAAWKERFPEFAKQVNEVKDLMGWRVLEKGCYREIDGSMAGRVMPLYTKEFKDLEEWRSNMRKDAEGKGEGTTINLVMPDFKESGKVPDRTSPDKPKKEVE